MAISLANALFIVYRRLTMTTKDDPYCPLEPAAPDLRPVDGPEADADLATLAKALAHPARVRILRILTHRNTCICGDIVGEMDLAQSTVSQHLKVLKEAGLIRGHVEGIRVCYCVDLRNLRRLRALVGSL
jgi:ArsR family transcriptional regulator